MIEIEFYIDGILKMFVYYGINVKFKNIKVKDIKKYYVIIMFYNSLELVFCK